MKYLINYFDCGILLERKGKAVCDFKISSIGNINKKNLYRFLISILFQGVKALAYADFCRAASLIDKKSHLTQEGLDEILEIKRGIKKVKKN